MRRSTKIFIGGFCIAAAVYVAGMLNTYRLAHQEMALEATCEATNRLPGAAAPSSADYHGRVVCSGYELQDLDTQGLQKQMVDAYRATQASKQWALPIAIVILALSALPWVWYALLRRIGELRSAIQGQPPEP